jgi:hypothetical protein
MPTSNQRSRNDAYANFKTAPGRHSSTNGALSLTCTCGLTLCTIKTMCLTQRSVTARSSHHSRYSPIRRCGRSSNTSTHLDTLHTESKHPYSLGKNHPKWMPRPDLVIYLGLSPQHARSVSLVLDMTTQNVSPQFHFRYDNLFKMVSNGQVNPPAQVSKWQSLGGFWEQPNKPHKGVSVIHTNIDLGEVCPQPVMPPALPEPPEILHDPDSEGSISRDQPSRAQAYIEGEVGPSGNPVDTTNPTGACLSGQTGHRLSASLNHNSSSSRVLWHMLWHTRPSTC